MTIPYQNIFVTGASGCVGWNICRELNRQGVTPHASVRPSTNLTRLDGIQTCPAMLDLTNHSQVIHYFKVKNIQAVIHAAANVSSCRRDMKQSFLDNVSATQCIVWSCVDSGVNELVYTSTGATMGIASDEEIHTIQNPYIKHKKMAENIVMGAIDKMKVNITNPIIVIGEHDFNNYVIIFESILKRGSTIIPHGAIEFCDAQDIALAHLKILELDNSVRGHRFVLGGEFLTWMEFVGKIAKAAGKNIPRRATPKPILYALA